MRRIQDILSWLRLIAPEDSALDGDPIGCLLDLRQDEISTVGVCLDATAAVARLAQDDGVKLLVSHHPLIYRPLKQIRESDPVGEAVAILIRSGISLYSMHTNWDCAQGGINDVLTSLIGLKNARPAAPEGDAKLIRIGEFEEPLTVSRLAKRIEISINATGQSALRYNPDFADIVVKTLAVCGGAGGSLIGDAVEAGADALLTADVKWDQFIRSDGLGFPVLDAGHGATERPGMQALADRLAGEFPDIAVKFYR